MPRAVSCLVLILVGVVVSDPPRDELVKPESESRPAPPGLELVDLGATNPNLKGYRAPKGFKVEIVAEAPTVVNPVGLTFADDGTPFVIEWPVSTGDHEEKLDFKYKDGSTRRIAVMTKRVKDVIKTLQINDKGIYDKAKVVLEEELPSTILLHDGWLYTASRGSVRRWKQSKADGPYDIKEVIAQGFCGYHHHQVSGLTIGNDGWLYISSGDDDNHVEGSDGSRATVLRTGAIFRCRPDGSKMEVFSVGFRNPYRDVAFDAVENQFHLDNDNEDGSKFTGCRLMHVVEGSDFGWRLRQGARCCVPDAVRGAVFGELPGKLPALLKTGRGAPAGLLIYNDSFLPENYRGLLYYPDVLRRSVRAYRVERKGASFKVVEEFAFLASDDPLFRPCQAVVGPDGALYVVDWRTDSGGAGRLSGDGKNGRIYRLTWGGTKDVEAIPTRGLDSWAKIRQLSDEELLKTLRSVNSSDRGVARRELVKRGDKNRAALLKVVEDVDAPWPARLGALGVLQSMWNETVTKAVRGLLLDSDSDIRRHAIDALGRNGAAKGVEAVGLLEDGDFAVRRAAALALARTNAPGSADILVTALLADDSGDVVLRDGLMRAVENQGKAGVDALVAQFESGDKKKINTVAEAFLHLRTRPAADVIPQLLTYPHLSAKQRADLVRSYTNYLLEPAVNLEPLVNYLVKNADEATEVKLAGLIALSSSDSLNGAKARQWLVGLLNERDAGLRLAAIVGVLQSRATEAAARLAVLLRDADAPLAEREAIVKALRVLNDKAALPTLADLVTGKAPEQAKLRLEALRTLFALDRGKARDVAWKVFDGGEAELQSEAVLSLGSDAKEAKELGQRYLDKKLRRELLREVSDVLKRHAKKGDTEAEELLAKVMKLGLTPSKKPEDLARLRELVKSKGNPQRGRALYLDDEGLACAKCHQLEGVGGNIGPDLTKLWQTHSLDKVIESMLEPSKEIKEGYQTFVVTTKKGQIHSGLKVSQNAKELVLRDVNGTDQRLALTEVESQEKSTVSLMPDNVVALLKYDEFIDLLAFLQDRASQESLRGQKRP